MFRSDLVEILNSRSAWALVGSGPSVDSGLPSWPQLLENILAMTPRDTREAIENSPSYKLGIRTQEIPRCFESIENAIGRPELELLAKRALGSPTRESRIVRFVTDWPFAGYITTNYDSLLEDRLNRGSDPGWIPVGNAQRELAKLAGDPHPGVVWHIHGALTLPSDASHLVLTSSDYDDIYLEDTPQIHQLKALLSLHRLVIVGFGMQDPDVLRILQRVGRLTDPTRPILAFQAKYDGVEDVLDPHSLLELYNIDIIPYRVMGTSHKALNDMASVYGSFILRRSIQFGQPSRPCPSHHPETTGLLLYNQLAARRANTTSDDVVRLLLRSRVLALLSASQTSITLDQLSEDLDARAAMLQRTRTEDVAGHTILLETLQSLVSEGLLLETGDRYELSGSGQTLTSEQSATAERLSDQFRTSIQSRCYALLPDDTEAALRVAAAADTFLQESIQKRALGVSLAQYGDREEYQDFHIVALLQELPKHLATMSDDNEAMALARLVQAIFAQPNQAEAQYIGVALQAQFGAHLLGYDVETLTARIRDFSESLFLLDSSTLIPFLAESSPGNESAATLVSTLSATGCWVATTQMLAGEVAEHARWALRQVDYDSGHVTTGTLEVATGRAGERPNAFLEGFLVQAEQGVVLPDLHLYMTKCLGAPAHRGKYSNNELDDAVTRNGILCKSFDEWEGFSAPLWHNRDELQEEIARLRVQYETYRHERQVKAEAEALLIIRHLRSGGFTISSKRVSNAFFVSQTRIIDQVAGDPTHPITMRPESVLQWTATLSVPPIEQLTALTNGLLWELSERGFTIVDPSKLVVTFGPLVTASRSQLQEELDRHHAAIAETYGEASIAAFREASPLDVPVILQSLLAQRVERLEVELELVRSQLGDRSKRSLSDKERQEFGDP